MNTSSAPFDQASGLREMFASLGAAAEAPSAAQAYAAPVASSTAEPAVHALLCPARPALTLPLAQICSRLLSEQGHRHAWIDELDFEEREQWPLPGTVRFDLGQSLANHVPLASALRPLDDPLRWYASARRLGLAAEAPPVSLAARLAGSGVAFEVVLVCARPQQRAWSLYADKVKPLLLCPIEPAKVKLTLDWLSQQSLGSAGLDLRHAGLMLLGKNSGPQDMRGEARAILQSSWQALFGQAPAWVDTADMRPDDSLTMLPPRWQALAQHLTGRLSGA